MNKRYLKTVSTIAFIPLLHFAAAFLWPDTVKIAIAHLLLIYGILATLTVIHLIIVRIVASRHHQEAPMIVMALNMFKMLLAIVLLFVAVVPLTGKGASVGINFAVAYVFFLIFDSQTVLMLLNSNAE
jgi:uncharacterized membrane protein